MADGIPVYHQIRRTVKHWLIDKRYGPNDRIPPENELAKMFEVNRMTIRQALSSLVDEGILIRKRGEGTFVNGDEELIRGMSLKHIDMVSELFLPIMKSKTLTVTLREVEPAPLIREKLEMLKKDTHAVKIQRDRILPEGIPAFTTNYLPLEIGKKLKESELLKRPLLKIMEEDLGINFTEAFQTMEASFAAEEEAKHLNIDTGDLTLLMERIMYGEKGKPVELVQTICEASKYKGCLSLKKVKRGSSYDWICQITK